MDPIVGSAIIGGVGKLLGGVFGRKSEKKAAAQALYQHRQRFVWTREDAERAGFNPLTALGTGSISAPVISTGNHMGQAIADAAMLASDIPVRQQELEVENQRLQLERDKLEARLQRATIRPKVGGLYAESTMTKRLGRGGANVDGRVTVDTSDPAKVVGQKGPFDMWHILPGQVGGPKVEYDLPESVKRQHMGPVNQSFTRSDGSVISLPVGMDFDEMLMGQVMDKGPDLYARAKDNWERSPFLLGPRMIVKGAGTLLKGAQATNAWAKGDIEMPKSPAKYEKRRNEFLNRPAARDLELNPYLNLKGY